MARHMENRIAAVVGQAGGQVAPVEDLLRMPFVEPLVRRSVAGSQELTPPGYYVHELGGAPMGDDPAGLWWIAGTVCIAVPISGH